MLIYLQTSLRLFQPWFLNGDEWSIPCSTGSNFSEICLKDLLASSWYKNNKTIRSMHIYLYAKPYADHLRWLKNKVRKDSPCFSLSFFVPTILLQCKNWIAKKINNQSLKIKGFILIRDTLIQLYCISGNVTKIFI